MSDVYGRILTAVQEASQLLSMQLMRHGVCEVLVQVHTSIDHAVSRLCFLYGTSATKRCCHLQQDVMRSASAWLPDAGTAALRELLVPTQHNTRDRLDNQLQIPGLHQLTGRLTSSQPRTCAQSLLLHMQLCFKSCSMLWCACHMFWLFLPQYGIGCASYLSLCVLPCRYPAGCCVWHPAHAEQAPCCSQLHGTRTQQLQQHPWHQRECSGMVLLFAHALIASERSRAVVCMHSSALQHPKDQNSVLCGKTIFHLALKADLCTIFGVCQCCGC